MIVYTGNEGFSGLRHGVRFERGRAEGVPEELARYLAANYGYRIEEEPEEAGSETTEQDKQVTKSKRGR